MGLFWDWWLMMDGVKLGNADFTYLTFVTNVWPLTNCWMNIKEVIDVENWAIQETDPWSVDGTLLF